DVNGDLICRFDKNDNGPAAGLIDTYTVDCSYSPWRTPVALTVVQNIPTTATLSWTELGEATAWVVAYKADNEEEFTEVNVNQNENENQNEITYTLTGLAGETNYTVKVRPDSGEGGSIKWSDAINFTTIEANPVPTNVTATAGTRKATLSWTAYGDSYNVRYKNKGLFQGFENDLSGWTTMNCVSKTGIYETVNANNRTLRAYRSGSHGFAFAASNNNQQCLISPELSITEGMKLEFYYSILVSSIQKKFQVGFSSATSAIEDFEWDDEVTVTKSDWSCYSKVIPPGTKYICIKQRQDSYNYYLLIDDISVYQTDWTTATTTETGITLTGLAPVTTYEYQVQSVRDGDESDWTDLATFTTLQAISIDLADDGTANATTLSTCDGEEDATVTLSGRTIYADGTWQALCLPFALNTLNGTPLDGFTVKELDTEGKWEKINGQWTTSSNGHQTGIDNDGNVYLHFKDATSIEAGKPYFVSKLVMDEGGTQPTYQATEGTAGSTTSQEFTNLIDGRGAGYTWRTSGLPSYCMFEASKPVYVTGYTLTTGNQNVNGHPTVWTLEARISESDEWTVIDSRNANQNSSDALPSERTANKNYTIQQPGVYKLFRFEVRQTNGNSFMCITELTLQGTPVVEGDVVNPVFTGVTINATAPATVSSLDAQVSITGSYDAVAANGKGRSLFFPGSGSRLYNAQAGTTLGACRAFFNIGDGSMQPTLGGSNCLQGIVVPNLLPGDANNDGFVTIDDVIAVVNYILGNTPDNFNVANADVDTNIGITITDAVTIVNMVLTQQEPEPETE
ncbi:MAG: fibronectin type III domain-containing protein, partial [Prevotella sp.]|nr:fibronectin type III domain-containing protein [Prevotella sp.]